MKHTAATLTNWEFKRADNLNHNNFWTLVWLCSPQSEASDYFRGNCIATSCFVDQYISAYKLIGDENPSPLLCLLIGVCFINIVCMKFTTQRATLAVQGVCFLDRYMKLRGPCQEVYYNLGKL